MAYAKLRTSFAFGSYRLHCEATLRSDDSIYTNTYLNTWDDEIAVASVDDLCLDDFGGALTRAALKQHAINELVDAYLCFREELLELDKQQSKGVK